ncbi:hypothetical protein [Pseudoruegeria sp. SHC-113]|uniref:hypothetical protein n=1 Tax=Pseudoruegeria sp. SHC-113 TaxID=2855439 RepID=UPI0021BAF9C2|nr:hypothetical protein [Pseudoruegeria sp. SHC-113]MCT8161680.1 hypothetical protein [Pseudoruegeria sp. SHC-113]
MKTVSMTKLKGLALSTSALVLSAGASMGAQVFATDLIVQGSACVGIDCSSSESFGFDTLRLKENNLRLHFLDTSSSASFPSNDWRITINDSSNGGANYFAVEDATAGRIPFRIEAGAPVNALYVEADGDVGIKTANPVVDLHIVEGNTPTMRLEQDGSDGFTPQTWDVAGNEANFFIRDVTNGSKLSFRIRPGAPESSIDIASDGDVGVGTSSPDAPLHVRRTNGTAQLHVEDASSVSGNKTLLQLTNNAGRPRIQMTNSGNGGPAAGDWSISAGDTFVIQDRTTASNVFVMDGAGNLTITGSLITTGGGGACTVADPCDRVFDPEVYTVPSIQEHAALMWENKYLPAVGPTGPDYPINMTEKMLRMLNELEHAHIYIAQLEERVVDLEKAIVTE